MSFRHKRTALIGIRPIILRVHFERLGAYYKTWGSVTYLCELKRQIEQFQPRDLKAAALIESQPCRMQV